MLFFLSFRGISSAHLRANLNIFERHSKECACRAADAANDASGVSGGGGAGWERGAEYSRFCTAISFRPAALLRVGADRGWRDEHAGVVR